MDLIDDIDHAANVREVRNVRVGRVRVFRNRGDPFQLLSEQEFRNRYRLSKECARHVVGLIEDLLIQPARNTDCSPTLQFLVSLRFFAKGCYQTELGDLHGLSQPTVSRIVRRVSEALATLLPQFITFPRNTERVQQEFYNLAHFPTVVGCIDCTHVAIKCPGQEQAQLYINRKGFYSLNVQVVCDASRCITDIVARWRGSTHDARIWDTCSLKREFEAGQRRGILLGDSGYPCKPYLLTPIANPRDESEEAYNAAQIRTRLSVERCFGEWKGMFRALKNGLQISLPTAKSAIVAMAVLFNIRKQFGEDYNYDDSDDSDDEDEVDEPQRADNDQQIGNVFRQQFIRRHFYNRQ